jgi:hypothetical protein
MDIPDSVKILTLLPSERNHGLQMFVKHYSHRFEVCVKFNMVSIPLKIYEEVPELKYEQGAN